MYFISLYSLAKDRHNFYDYVDVHSMEQINKDENLKTYEIVVNQRGYRKGKIVGQYRIIDFTSEYIMSALLNRYFLEQLNGDWETTYWGGHDPKKPVAILVRKNDLNNIEEVIRNRKKDILLDTHSYLIFKTGKTLSQLMVGDRLANLKQLYVI